MRKAYIVGDPAGEWAIVRANFLPPDYIADAPTDPLTGKLEQKEWLVLQDAVDEFGRSYKIAVVDTAAKNAYLQAVEDTKKAKKDKGKADKDLKNLIKDFSKSDLTDLSSVRDAIDNIYNYIKSKENL